MLEKFSLKVVRTIKLTEFAALGDVRDERTSAYDQAPRRRDELADRRARKAANAEGECPISREAMTLWRGPAALSRARAA